MPRGMHLRGDVFYSCFRANGKQVRKRLSSDFDTAKKMLNELRSRADTYSVVSVKKLAIALIESARSEVFLTVTPCEMQ